MDNCTVCNQPLKLIPAGIAKITGRAYEAFWVCSSGLKHQQAKAAFKPSPNAQNSPTPQNNLKDELIFNLLTEINGKVDKLLKETGVE